MRVPLVDLSAQYRGLRDQLMPALDGLMHRAQFILGDEVEQFESRFARYCRVDHCVGVSSGTEALHLALRAVGVGPESEVITAANTFVATAMAIAYAGASPVLVDVDPNTYTMDIDQLSRAITPRTKAIIPVHLYGHMADMDPILGIARDHGLRVVEDACQAHGGTYKGQPAGSMGDVGCFSFYPGKNLGAFGDGGAVVTRDEELAHRLRLLRNYGQESKNVHSVLGFNSRLDTLQAAVLLVKLDHLNVWNGRRRAAAHRYTNLLRDVDAILPTEGPEIRHVYHLYVIRHPRRDELLNHLSQHSIACGIHYPRPVHHAAPFRSARTVPEGAPVSTVLAREILSLPIYPEISTEQIELVADAMNSFGRPARVGPVELANGNGRKKPA